MNYGMHVVRLLQLHLSILILSTEFVLALTEANELFTAHQGKYPVGHNKMESFRLLAVMLSWMLLGIVGNLAPYMSELYSW